MENTNKGGRCIPSRERSSGMSGMNCKMCLMAAMQVWKFSGVMWATSLTRKDRDSQDLRNRGFHHV